MPRLKRRPFPNKPAGRPFHPRIMNGVTLPQNLVTSAGTLLEDFENIADWSQYIAGTFAADTTYFKSGAQGIEITSNVGGSGRIQKTVNLSMPDFGRMDCWIYIKSPLADYSSGTAPSVIFSETADYSTSWYAKLRYPVMRPGWNRLSAHQSRFYVNGGSPSWSNPQIRLRCSITPVASKTVVATYDKLTVGIRSLPTVMLMFDDGYAAVHSTVFPLLRAHNIRGTVMMTTGVIGTAGYLTAAQLQELDAAGWTIANHSDDTTSLSGLSEADQETHLLNAYNTLVGLGLTKGAKYVAYPGATYNEDTFTAMANLGMLLGRAAEGYALNNRMYCPPPYAYLLNTEQVNSSDSVASITGYVDATIVDQSVLTLHFHDVTHDVSEWTYAQLEQFVNYLVTKKDQIYEITMDDYYQLQSHAVLIPKVF